MNTSCLSRSNLLLSRHDSALLVVDAQEKLLALIPGHDRMVWNMQRLLDGATILEIPRLATEQYPAKLGGTDSELTSRLGSIPDKLTFSCGGCEEFVKELTKRPTRRVLIVGIETHVCVLQTTLDLLTAGYEVDIAVDAVGSRHRIDHDTALRRMESSGVTLTTTESALFEWCEVAGTDEFKQISQIVRRSPPES